MIQRTGYTDCVEPDGALASVVREHNDDFVIGIRRREIQRIQLESIDACGAIDGLS